MNYVADALENALTERLNELLVALSKNPDVTPSHADNMARLDAFRERLTGNAPLLEAFEELLSDMRCYSAEENRACYLSGVRDFRNLLLGKLPFSLEKRE